MTKQERTIRALLRERAGVRLDLGCGGAKQEGGFIGIDCRHTPAVDIVHDLESFPWPLPNGCATAVVMSHFYEHIKPWLVMPFMAELHRVCRDGTLVFISAPYGVGPRFIQDPTHCNPSNETTWQYFDDRSPLWGIYQPPIFRVESYQVIPAGGDRDFNAVLRCTKVVHAL